MIDEVPVKKKTKIYFGKDVQNAIIEYNGLPDSASIKKTKLFNTLIYPAFDKLVENIINTWKFHRYETTYIDLKQETVTDLYYKISGYNPEKGRAYSYFTIVARNYLIKKAQVVFEDEKKIDLENVDIERNVSNEVLRLDYEESLKDFLRIWCDWCELNVGKLFKSKRDKRVADALIEMLRSTDEITLYNKKLLYVLIRERANVDTQHITKIVKRFKELFQTQFEEYRVNGFIDSSKYL